MVKISPLNDKTQGEFEKLFKAYYDELDCDDDVPHLLEEYVLPDLKAGLIRIEIMQDDSEYAGFVIFQCDRIENEWCPREGWGDIREIYVIPSKRKNGLGKFLLYTAEMKLREDGTEKCYALPSENSEGFFTACGYLKGNLYDEDLECFAYEKLNLNNKCK
ncbi:MAG: GNAT family N-acetyltransferase [Clostridia bacterium]|nr:GNAT family N-acetyltransferase [Clostridia bacterium]